MMAWKPSVNLLVRWYVGGDCLVRSTCSTEEMLVPLFSVARRRASWIEPMPLVGHQPSATSVLRPVSMLKRLSVA